VSVFSGSIGIRLPQGLQHKNDSEHAHQFVDNSCKSLLLHEEGRWEHQYAPLESNHNFFDNSQQKMSVILSNTYHPIEIDWIMTNTTSYRSGWSTCDRDNDGGLMYVSKIGNQCGCGLPEFHPSISQWISDSGNPTQPAANISMEHHDISSPSLRLTLELAKGNRSLCFVGDSIDLQFFDALKHNLRRQKYLQNQINISISTNYSIPVDYTNDTGFPPHRGQMIMNEIKEMKVSFRYVADDDYYSDAHTNTATVRYYKMYGWSPWTTSFLDDCNIVIMNLGLHYNARGAMKGIRKWNLSYKDDVKAAMILGRFCILGKGSHLSLEVGSATTL